jgi:hypothetical protein
VFWRVCGFAGFVLAWSLGIFVFEKTRRLFWWGGNETRQTRYTNTPVLECASSLELWTLAHSLPVLQSMPTSHFALSFIHPLRYI